MGTALVILIFTWGCLYSGLNISTRERFKRWSVRAPTNFVWSWPPLNFSFSILLSEIKYHHYESLNPKYQLFLTCLWKTSKSRSDTTVDTWSKNVFLGCPYYFALFSAFAPRFEFRDVSKDAEMFSVQNWLSQ
jgi:hypothetical protein